MQPDRAEACPGSIGGRSETCLSQETRLCPGMEDALRQSTSSVTAWRRRLTPEPWPADRLEAASSWLRALKSLDLTHKKLGS